MLFAGVLQRNWHAGTTPDWRILEATGIGVVDAILEFMDMAYQDFYFIPYCEHLAESLSSVFLSILFLKPMLAYPETIEQFGQGLINHGWVNPPGVPSAAVGGALIALSARHALA